MLVQTMSAALLLEQAVGDVRKGVVALRYARKHLAPRPMWDDRLSAELGRELLAHALIDEGRADKVAGHR
jgi:hypothetical protein